MTTAAARSSTPRGLIRVLRRVTPLGLRTRVRSLRRRQRRLTTPIRWGSLRRVQPVSDSFGNDRGTPVDRVYIAEFLSTHATDIRGRVLEVKDPASTHRHAVAGVESVDVVDIDATNPQATVVADLSVPGSLPAERFDCILLIQTLQYLPDVEAALRNAYQALTPGGVLLVTAPGLSRIDPLPDSGQDLHRFTPGGLGHVLQGALPDAAVTCRGYGNVLSATAFLYGVAAEELRRDELAHDDPHFPVVAAARVQRPLPTTAPPAVAAVSLDGDPGS